MPNVIKTYDINGNILSETYLHYPVDNVVYTRDCNWRIVSEIYQNSPERDVTTGYNSRGYVISRTFQNKPEFDTLYHVAESGRTLFYYHPNNFCANEYYRKSNGIKKDTYAKMVKKWIHC
jgi:hypothetical protein